MTKKHSLLSVLSLGFCLLSGYSAPAISNIYKWVDEEGKVHYSQQRPAATASEKMKINAHAPQDSSSYKRPSLNKESDDTAKADKADTKETDKDAPKVESAAEKKRRLAACTQARQQLATMQAKGQIRSRDKDGNTTYMSQEQKESRMKNIRDAIAKQCK